MAQTTTITTGSTSLILNNSSYHDFIQGNAVELTFKNSKAERTIGENGIVNINERVDANEAELTVRLMRHSDDDIKLSAITNTPGITVLTGSFVETVVTDGVSRLETYTITAGNLMKYVEKTVNNEAGDYMAEYVIACSAKRSV